MSSDLRKPMESLSLLGPFRMIVYPSSSWILRFLHDISTSEIAEPMKNTPTYKLIAFMNLPFAVLCCYSGRCESGCEALESQNEIQNFVNPQMEVVAAAIKPNR